MPGERNTRKGQHTQLARGKKTLKNIMPSFLWKENIERTS
jgi:hypothetical protein